MFEELLRSQGLSEEQITAIMAAKNKDESGLKTKAQELLDKLGKKNTAQGESEAELERLRQLEKNTKISSEEAKQNYDAALKLATEGHEGALAKSASEAEKWKNMFSQVAVDNALASNLEKAGITDPSLRQGAIAMLKPQISLGEDGKAVAGETSLENFIGDFAQSDIGKAFITLPNNSGGQAHGGQGDIGKYEGKKLSDLGSDERTQLRREEPEVYAELKERK